MLGRIFRLNKSIVHVFHSDWSGQACSQHEKKVRHRILHVLLHWGSSRASSSSSSSPWPWSVPIKPVTPTSIMIPSPGNVANTTNAGMARPTTMMGAWNVANTDHVTITSVPTTIPTDANNVVSFRGGVSTVLRRRFHSVNSAVPHRITRNEIMVPLLLKINQNESWMNLK